MFTLNLKYANEPGQIRGIAQLEEPVPVGCLSVDLSRPVLHGLKVKGGGWWAVDACGPPLWGTLVISR